MECCSHTTCRDNEVRPGALDTAWARALRGSEIFSPLHGSDFRSCELSGVLTRYRPGAIFKATNLHNQQVVALKLQDVHHECPTNRYERGFYPSLQGGLGMPTLYAHGVEGTWDYLAIDLLGASLDSLYRKSGKGVMDLRSVCCIGMQMVSGVGLPPLGAVR